MEEIRYEQGKIGKLDQRNLGDLSVEVSAYGGTMVIDAIRQMIGLAAKLNIDVWCNLNGVRTLAKPGDTVNNLYTEWERERFRRPS